MTRSISLAAFFVLILAGVFLFTGSKTVRARQGEDTLLRMLSPRVQVVTSEREGGPTKFQLAISTDPSSLSQINREATSVSAKVRASIILVNTSYQVEVPAKDRKKAPTSETRVLASGGVLIGDGAEILTVIPRDIIPASIQAEFSDGSSMAADFIGRDDASQIALLRLSSPAPSQALGWRNRRSLEWGEHFYAMTRGAQHGTQMFRVMVSGDVVLPPLETGQSFRHPRQLDQALPRDFQGAVLVDGSGQVAGMVIQTGVVEALRAQVVDSGTVRVVAEALRSLQKLK